MNLKEKQNIYWLTNISGWGLYILISLIFSSINNGISAGLVANMVWAFILGVFLSHMYRKVIIAFNWFELPYLYLFFMLFSGALVCGSVFLFLHTSILYIFGQEVKTFFNTSFFKIAPLVMLWSITFFCWSVIYFSYHYFERSRREQMKNLKLEAVKNEIELNNLKSQLNPHFLFNALNSVRTLIGEEPERAKSALTKLSFLLRNTLTSGKNDRIPLKKEMEIVHSYLDIEKIRYEDRLNVEINIPKETENALIPPLMIQTIVENAVKHGISNLNDGGTVKIESYLSNNELVLSVINDGRYDVSSEKNGESFGLDNTKKRLELIYGEDGIFHIFNEDNKVRSKIKIPFSNERYNSIYS
ncbi:MAG: sensor histidine kinase [Flavobacteriales bacterium]